MTHLLLHSLLTIRLLSATPEETRFLEAITKDDVAAVRAILKEDPSLARTAKSARGNSALVVAAYVMTDGEYFYPPAKNQVLQEVIRHAPPADVFEACLVGDLARARVFLDKDPNAVRDVERAGWTLLHAAAYSGNLEAVKLLISRGARIDAVANTKYKNTPIQTAMLTGQGAVARALVEAGADVNHKQWEGFTVLHDAARQGDLDLVRFFIKHGADVNARTIRGETPVISAQSHGHPEVAAELEKLAMKRAQ
jgi:ankyrin repeat protein